MKRKAGLDMHIQQQHAYQRITTIEPGLTVRSVLKTGLPIPYRTKRTCVREQTVYIVPASGERKTVIADRTLPVREGGWLWVNPIFA